MALVFGPRNFLRQKSAKGAKKYIKTRYRGNQFSGFWNLSEVRLLTPARPRYLLTPDSFFPLRLRRAVLPALVRVSRCTRFFFEFSHGYKSPSRLDLSLQMVRGRTPHRANRRCETHDRDRQI